jgi:TM2 domain-containing membrane protein YozV
MALVPCASCGRHVQVGVAECPFCKATLLASPILPVVDPSALMIAGRDTFTPAAKYGGPPSSYLSPRITIRGGKSKALTIALCILPAAFGICGMHRFYTGHIGIGIAQLLTFGGFGIWQLIDLISIFTGKYTDRDGQPLVSNPG